jgi:hypothetical protein
MCAVDVSAEEESHAPGVCRALNSIRHGLPARSSCHQSEQRERQRQVIDSRGKGDDCRCRQVAKWRTLANRHGAEAGGRSPGLDRLAQHQEPTELAVEAAKPAFDLEGLARLTRPREGVEQTREIVGVDRGLPTLA